MNKLKNQKRRSMGHFPFKAVFFDFDGVILESADIKTCAYAELFKQYPRQHKQILSYHLKHGGISRYRKFNYIYKHILKHRLSPAERRRLGRTFKELVFKKILSCSLVPGTHPLLTAYARKCALFILSGTPQPELKQIVRSHGLTSFFRGIYGSPRTKENLVAFILDKHKLSPGDVLYVGDALTDWMAASRYGITFVGRVVTEDNSIFPKDVPCVRDMKELARWLKKR